MSRQERRQRIARHPVGEPEVTGKQLPSMKPKVERALSKSETHDLSMIIKERTKVLKYYAEEQAAKRLAEFEQHMATVSAWDQDEVWQKATEEAMKVVAEAQKTIAARAKELKIPPQFAPGLMLDWRNRGQNVMSQRRTELRRVAKVQIEAMTAEAIRKIEKQSLDLRMEVIRMGLLSPEGASFLESFAPVEDAMGALDFKKVELEYQTRQEPRRLPPGSTVQYE